MGAWTKIRSRWRSEPPVSLSVNLFTKHKNNFTAEVNLRGKWSQVAKTCLSGNLCFVCVRVCVCVLPSQLTVAQCLTSTSKALSSLLSLPHCSNVLQLLTDNGRTPQTESHTHTHTHTHSQQDTVPSSDSHCLIIRQIWNLTEYHLKGSKLIKDTFTSVFLFFVLRNKKRWGVAVPW